MNVTVQGIIDREDVDCFAVEAKEGERISVEVEGIRLGRTVLDSKVTIYGPDGSPLKTADGSSLVLQDAIASIVAPKTGTYTIELRESSYGGSRDSVYRMHVGNFPRPMAVYPAGGKAGETLSVNFIGDPKGEFTQNFKLPETSDERFGVVAEQAGLLAPSQNWLRVSSFPNVMESEPNDDQQHATGTDLELPLALNGVISKPGDVDWFKFKAKKGQAYDVNVYARRIRSMLDSTVQIVDAKGSSIAQNDDSAGLDSYVKFTAPADGSYFLKVTDQLGKGGPEFTYRVELNQIPAAVSLYIPDVSRNNTQERKSIVIAKGNRFATLLSVKKSNFSGDLELKPQGLPSGVTMYADAWLSKLDKIPVVFEADANSEVTGKFFNLIASSTNPEKPVSGGIKQDFELVLVNNVGTYHTFQADKLAVAIVEELPFKLSIVEPKVPLVQYGTIDLKVVADRKPGFEEPISVRMLWNPPGVASVPDLTIPKGEKSIIYKLSANGGADIHKWKIAVIGSATVSGGTAWVSSQLAPLEVTEPFMTVKIDLAKVEQGQSTKVICKVDQRVPFDGKALVKLMGLPAGCTAADKQITKDDKEIVFDVVTDAKAQVGLNKSLFCNVVVEKDSQPIVHNLGSGILRIDAARIKVADAKSAIEKAQAEKPASAKKK
jgi:hypothetical protein